MSSGDLTIKVGDALRRRLSGRGVDLPVGGERVRVAFVGQRTYFESSALNAPTAGIEPAFIDFRLGDDGSALVADLAAFAPHVVIMFRPETLPARLFKGLSALTVGFLTEPLPRPTAQDEHPDLKRRLAYLAGVDEGNFDRIISFDPLVVESAGKFLDIWRSVPLPVADEYFRPVERWKEPPRPTFIGRSTRYREAWLADAKHFRDVLHVAHGIVGEELREFLAAPMLSINVHNEAYPTFEVRVPLCLAAGHLVASEPLSPTHGLEPDVDFLEMFAAMNLVPLIDQIQSAPNTYHQVRVMGRMKAESFRASTVFTRLVRDLFDDVATFGRPPQRQLPTVVPSR